MAEVVGTSKIQELSEKKGKWSFNYWIYQNHIHVYTCITL